MAREVVVIGAGIVGASLAHELSTREGVQVTVLERDTREPQGSTALAPGFVGLYNDVPILTELARTSAAIYSTAPSGFAQAGGLELATSEAGAIEVERRATAAQAAGLPARLLAPAELPGPVAAFVDRGQVVAAGHFADDAVARPNTLTRALREAAIARGARFLPGREVTRTDRRAGRSTVTTASGDLFTADDVVLAGGVWGPSLAALTGLDLPLFPVAHPYVYSRTGMAWEPGPFVRWPEHHVYARVHDDRLGIGSYDHTPVHVGQASLVGGASLPWSEDFTSVITSAQRLLAVDAQFTPEQCVNGVFAMTPDNLPFLGPHPTLDGVWVAQAIWVTHASGSAAMLTAALTDGADLPSQLAVDRFDGADTDTLRTSALRLYRDIYANDMP